MKFSCLSNTEIFFKISLYIRLEIIFLFLSETREVSVNLVVSCMGLVTSSIHSEKQFIAKECVFPEADSGSGRKCPVPPCSFLKSPGIGLSFLLAHSFSLFIFLQFRLPIIASKLLFVAIESSHV